MPNVSDLPYSLPPSLEGKIDYLADLLGIRGKAHLKRMHPRQAVELLVGLVLYHHLDRQGKRAVSGLMGQAPRQVLFELQTVMATPLVQRDWGMWSLTTTELLERKKELSTFNAWASFLGLSFSITSVGDLHRLRLTAANAPGVVLTLAIWGFVALTEMEEGLVDDEMMRRVRG